MRQHFTGQERDNEAGLDYFQARYFANTQGRFTSPDPLIKSGKVGVPQSWNRYSYCLNHPLTFVDPTGLEWRTNDKTGKLRWYAKMMIEPVPLNTPTSTIELVAVNGFISTRLDQPTTLTTRILPGEDGTLLMQRVSLALITGPICLPCKQAKGDQTGALKLLFEFLTGTGPADREFGPSDYMTQGMMTSPDVAAARQKFIDQAIDEFARLWKEFKSTQSS